MTNNSPGGYISTGVVGQRYNAGIPTNGTDAVQTLTGAATGGTFTLTFGGRTTPPLAYNASAAVIQAALQALGSIGGGNVLCTGGPLGTGAVVCTFAGDLSGLPASPITVDNTLATGGAVAVANTTTGIAGTARGCLTGTTLTDTVNAKHYINSGTSTKPIWTVVGSQS